MEGPRASQPPGAQEDHPETEKGSLEKLVNFLILLPKIVLLEPKYIPSLSKPQVTWGFERVLCVC